MKISIRKLFGNISPIALTYGAEEGDAVFVTQAAPLPTGGLREAFPLVSANVASAPVTVYGGDYIFCQTATAYGTVKLQVLGPDAATWLDVLSKASADTTGGTGVSLGSGAVVRVLLTSTSGAAATLARVP